MVLRGTVSLHTTAREGLLQAALEHLKPNSIGQNPRKENVPRGESTPDGTSESPLCPIIGKGGGWWKWHGAHLCGFFYYFSSWSLKFQIAENILHGIQGLMKLFFSKSGLNSWRYPTSWFASLFSVFRSFSVAFVLRTVTLLEIDKTWNSRRMCIDSIYAL